MSLGFLSSFPFITKWTWHLEKKIILKEKCYFNQSGVSMEYKCTAKSRLLGELYIINECWLVSQWLVLTLWGSCWYLCFELLTNFSCGVLRPVVCGRCNCAFDGVPHVVWFLPPHTPWGGLYLQVQLTSLWLHLYGWYKGGWRSLWRRTMEG